MLVWPDLCLPGLPRLMLLSCCHVVPARAPQVGRPPKQAFTAVLASPTNLHADPRLRGLPHAVRHGQPAAAGHHDCAAGQGAVCAGSCCRGAARYACLWEVPASAWIASAGSACGCPCRDAPPRHMPSRPSLCRRRCGAAQGAPAGACLCQPEVPGLPSAQRAGAGMRGAAAKDAGVPLVRAPRACLQRCLPYLARQLNKLPFRSAAMLVASGYPQVRDNAELTNELADILGVAPRGLVIMVMPQVGGSWQTSGGSKSQAAWSGLSKDAANGASALAYQEQSGPFDWLQLSTATWSRSCSDSLQALPIIMAEQNRERLELLAQQASTPAQLLLCPRLPFVACVSACFTARCEPDLVCHPCLLPSALRSHLLSMSATAP